MWINLTIDVLLFFYVIICALMCLVIMMQRSKQEGLGAAFGGGLTESMWGAQTSQVLVKATVWFAALFFILSISLARLYSHRAEAQGKTSPVMQELLQPAVPIKPPASTNAAAPVPTPSAPTNAATVPATPLAPANAATPAPLEPGKPAAK